MNLHSEYKMQNIQLTVDALAEKYALRDAAVECCGACRHFKQEYDADSAPDRGTCWHPLMQGCDDLHGGPLVYPRPTDICDLYESLDGRVLHKVLTLSEKDLGDIGEWLACGHPDYKGCGNYGVVTSWSVTFDDGVTAELRVNHDDDGNVWLEMMWFDVDGAQRSQATSEEYCDVDMEWYEDHPDVHHNVIVRGENE